MVGYNTLHSRMKMKPHSHVYEQIFMLIRGRLKLHVADQVFDMIEGSVVRLPDRRFLRLTACTES